MRRFFLLGDFSFGNHISDMREVLMDLIDIQTALDIRNWIGALSGPFYVMAEAYNLGKPLDSFINDLYFQETKSNNGTVDELLDRLKKFVAQ
jgi:hypothetical protein